MSQNYTREGDPHARPVASPAVAEACRAWARYLLSLDEARARARRLDAALSAPGIAQGGKFHPTMTRTVAQVRGELAHEGWLLELLASSAEGDAPALVSALTGTHTPDPADGPRADMHRYALEALLAELGATDADREEFGLPSKDSPAE